MIVWPTINDGMDGHKSRKGPISSASDRTYEQRDDNKEPNTCRRKFGARLII
jgi:hypothetical protein